eukprot:6194537-Pleurochrysis_carterae.AAC.2
MREIVGVRSRVQPCACVRAHATTDAPVRATCGASSRRPSIRVRVARGKALCSHVHPGTQQEHKNTRDSGERGRTGYVERGTALREAPGNPSDV